MWRIHSNERLPLLEDIFLYVVLLVFGLAFGSFANVVIWRLPRHESLSSPGSHCPACETPISWFDNIPVVSWMILRGRCRSCSVRISARYPVVEGLVALLWVVCGVQFGATAYTAFAAFLTYLLVILSAIDLDTQRLPNPLVLVLGLVGLAGILMTELTSFHLVPLTRPAGTMSPLAAAAIGSLSAGGLSYGIAAAYKGVRGKSGFGMGDVKLLIALGPFLGVYNFGVLFLGSVLGAVGGVIIARKSSDGMATRIPFGPFLAAAAAILLFFGPNMWAWYARLVGLV